MRFLLSIVTAVLGVLLLPVLRWHPRLKSSARQRLGFVPAFPDAKKRGGLRVWLHGASHGDIVTLSPLAEALRMAQPDVEIVVSALTATGLAYAAKRGDLFDHVVPQPLDALGAPRRALQRIAPDVLVLEYTELWPGLIGAAHARGTRVVLANGRIAKKNVGRYRRLSALVGGLFERIDLFLMRNPDEAERVVEAGADGDRVWVTGNTKFDALHGAAPRADVDALRTALGWDNGAPELVWTCGSTQEAEDALFTRVFLALRAEIPGLHLVIAPRHTERSARLLSMLHAEGLDATLRSSGEPARGDVTVLDTMGELRALYALSSIVVVGGSFVPRGGQNILEPAAEAKPVLFGPLMAAQRDLVDVLVGRGGIQVRDEAHLRGVLRDLLLRPDERARLGEIGAARVKEVRGASRRNAVHVLQMMAEPPRGAA